VRAGDQLLCRRVLKEGDALSFYLELGKGLLAWGQDSSSSHARGGDTILFCLANEALTA